MGNSLDLTTIGTNQDALEAIARSVIAGGLARMAEYVETPESDIEVVIKIVNSAAKEIGKVIPEKKTDPNAGLATFHITFINGAMQGTVTPAAEVLEVVEEVPLDELAQLGLEPTPAMLAATNHNADLVGLYLGD